MNACTAGVILIAAASFQGCTFARPPKIVHATQPAAVVVDPSAIVVPLPKTTPFDAEPAARAAYLEFFEKGYRLSASNFATAGCMCGSESSLAHYEACMSGYADGIEAGTAGLNAIGK